MPCDTGPGQTTGAFPQSKEPKYSSTQPVDAVQDRYVHGV